jgi:hypothetical protein
VERKEGAKGGIGEGGLAIVGGERREGIGGKEAMVRMRKEGFRWGEEGVKQKKRAWKKWEETMTSGDKEENRKGVRTDVREREDWRKKGTS